MILQPQLKTPVYATCQVVQYFLVTWRVSLAPLPATPVAQLGLGLSRDVIQSLLCPLNTMPATRRPTARVHFVLQTFGSSVNFFFVFAFLCFSNCRKSKKKKNNTYNIFLEKNTQNPLLSRLVQFRSAVLKCHKFHFHNNHPNCRRRTLKGACHPWAATWTPLHYKISLIPRHYRPFTALNYLYKTIYYVT